MARPKPPAPGAPASPAADFARRLQEDIDAVARDRPPEPEPDGCIGRTTFDSPASEDTTVSVLLARDKLKLAPAQSLVRIESRADGRKYLGTVTAGPFAEPDSLRADSPILKAVATHGGQYLPPHHGRVQVTLMGEELPDGTLVPPRWRPLPHSPVFALADEESAKVLRAEGDLRLGLAVGHDALPVAVPSSAKGVLPQHTAILGTTGGGKSTTVAGLIARAQAAGIAVVLLDVEGEYTHLHEPTDDARMIAALKAHGLEARGLDAKRTHLYHLAGRETANPGHPNLRPFSLQFARLSPYAVMAILDLTEPQQQRFMKAYDITKELMRDLGIFPEKKHAEQERFAMELDEFDRGYPRMTLSLLMDVVSACMAASEPSSKSSKKDDDEGCAEFEPFHPRLKTPEGKRSLQTRLHAANPPGNVISWRALLGRLARLNRLKVFFNEQDGVKPINYKPMLQPGHVSIVDLSDSGMSELTNLVIADLLRGLQEAQDEAYQAYESATNKATQAPPRTLIVVEEAHEFLSVERIEKMNILFEQVSRIAKRGRKRWLGLAFVTQLPAHLPRQVLSLCNNFVLHKLTDPQVVAALKRSIHGIDEGLWNRLPGLAPGQAIVSFGHMTRPLLTAIDPSPCKLKMAD